MERWTEEELRQVASNTRIAERTIDACRDVLVEGMTGVAAAEKHKMFPAQISRALTILRDKQSEMIEKVAVRKETLSLEQYIASEVGRALVGNDFQCNLAQAGRVYEGSMLAQSNGFFVQKVGRTGVLHATSSFVHVPPMNQLLTVSYDRADGKASVSFGHSKTQGVER